MHKGSRSKKYRIYLILGFVFLAGAILFVLWAITHPESSFPWSNKVTYAIYGLYVAATLILFSLAGLFSHRW